MIELLARVRSYPASRQACRGCGHTSRRSGAEYAISLRKRRQWFAEGDPDKGEAGASAGTEKTGDEGQQDNRIPYSRFQEVNKAKIAAEAELQKYRDAEAARQLKEQQEAGEFQKIIDSLKPKVERVEALEKALKAYLDAEIADIPEDMRSLVPEGDVTAQLNWVKQAKTAGLFKKPQAAPLDGGKQGDGGGSPSIKLTPEQEKAALAAGMTKEQFAKALAATSKPT